MIISPTRFFASLGAVVALSASLPATAMAQDRHVIGGGRVAGIAPPPVYVVQPSFPGFQQFGGPFQQFGGPFVATVPVVLLPDGRLYANFGFGYEPVARRCGANVVAPGVASYAVSPFPVVAQPTITQPVPVQPTASEQMLGRQLGSPATALPALPGPLSAQPLTASCWGHRGGSVVVFRP